MEEDPGMGRVFGQHPFGRYRLVMKPGLLRPRALELDWSAYNEWAQQDVVRYRIYLGSQFFDTVAGKTPSRYVTDGRQKLTLDGLENGTIYYVAVVAEDALGQINPKVRSVSAITTPKLEMSIPDLTVNEGSTLQYRLEVTERDLTGYDLSFGLVSGPPGMSVDRTGVLSWRPGEEDGPGVFPVMVKVTDNGIPPITATDEFLVKVGEVNQAPTFVKPRDATIDVGVEYSQQLQAEDLDLPVQPLNYSLVSGPANSTVGGATGVFHWLPSDSDGGTTSTIVVAVSDGQSTGTASFKLTVRSAPLPVPLVMELSQGRLVLRWTSADLRWRLESSGSVAGGWEPDQAVPERAGNDWVVTLSPTGQQRFFRLKGQ